MYVLKNFLVILCLCIFAKFFVLGVEINNPQKQAWIDDCLNQLNSTVKAVGLEERIDPAQTGCFIACMVKKLRKNNETLRDVLNLAVDEIKTINKELYDQLIDKLEKCSKEAAGDDCQLMECIDLFSVPYYTLLHLRPARDLH